MEFIQVEQKDKFSVVRINRESALNALNEQVLLELRQALIEIENSKVVVLTGAGSKAFIAGADIKAMAEMNPLQARAFAELGQGVVELLGEAPYISIAAVNGFALGGGLEMAVACDLIYCSENAKFGAPETNLGIVPGFGGTSNIVDRVGRHHAMDLILTGKSISAEEAKRIGLSLEVFPSEELMAKVEKTAETLSAKGTYSMLSARRLVRSANVTERQRSLLLERESFGSLFATSEPKEGMTAFVEKRKPNFS